jgi:hypothetical protein
MPPQQSHGLLDGFDKRFSFGAHVSLYETGKRVRIRQDGVM